ncbi:hypothetical protein F511_37307 [Dorcoceras hygrometricum]|uniref:Uncharacterized protein n=1 Tax=Dorcoceras hygrometricum TaxID=472368 RepID=A0A2Z7AKU0_9LAMI|nr:hypothetical protein F511_37307 [Dorcoceras hygrometricum]
MTFRVVRTNQYNQYLGLIHSTNGKHLESPNEGLLVQADEGVLFAVVDLIRRSTAAYLLKCRFPCETGRSQAPRRQQEAGRGAAARGGASRAHDRARSCVGLAMARFKSRTGRTAAYWPTVASGHAQDVARRRAQLGCAMGCASRSGVRPCAARYVGGGRRPANLWQ